jgi:hypothetical protein
MKMIEKKMFTKIAIHPSTTMLLMKGCISREPLLPRPCTFLPMLINRIITDTMKHRLQMRATLEKKRITIDRFEEVQKLRAATNLHR